MAQVRPPEVDNLVPQVQSWLERPGDTSAAAVRARLRGWVPEYGAATLQVPAPEATRSAA